MGWEKQHNPRYGKPWTQGGRTPTQHPHPKMPQCLKTYEAGAGLLSVAIRCRQAQPEPEILLYVSLPPYQGHMKSRRGNLNLKTLSLF